MNSDMAQPLIDTDRTSAPRFLTLDRRVPEAIRQLLDEADGCAMSEFIPTKQLPPFDKS